MKKVLLLLIFFFGISCTKKKEEVLKEEIENHIKKGLNDPGSYEFVSFKIDSSMADIYNEIKKLHLKKKDTVR